MTPERAFGAGGAILRDVGERRLLERLVEVAGGPAPGDDAMVWTPPPGRDLAVSIDAVVEGVDFRRGWLGPRALGRRAFNVAVSDLAGMGARPEHCVVTLCARADEQVDDVIEVQVGLCEAAADAGCAVVGGDVSEIDGPLVVDVCVTGSLPGGSALRRSTGRPGDALLVTGSLGRAAAGLRLLLAGDAVSSTDENDWVAAQLQPVPRLREGMQLLDAGVVCGGDISDGLVIDAARTARASGCAIDIWVDSLPVAADLRSRFGHDWLQLAVAGGEDFELAVTVPGPAVAALLAAWPADLAPLTVVGTLRAGSGVRLLDRRGGSEVAVPGGTAGHWS